MRLQNSVETKQSLTEESSSNDSDVDNPDAVELGTNNEREILTLNYKNCFKQIIEPKHIADMIKDHQIQHPPSTTKKML